MTAGPALVAAVSPVVTKMPAPIIAPTPREVSAIGPRTRRRRFSPSISGSSVSSGSRENTRSPIMPGPFRPAAGSRLVPVQRHTGRRDAVRLNLPPQLLAQDAVVPAVEEVDAQAERQPADQPEPVRRG